MTGHRNRVVVQIKEEEKRALYTHCYAHSLNLPIGDTMKNFALLKHTIDNTSDLTNLVKKLPKKDSKFKEIQNSLAIADNRDNEDYELNEAKHGIIGVHRPLLKFSFPLDTKAPGPPLIYLVGPLAISDPRINICVGPPNTCVALKQFNLLPPNTSV